MKTQQKTNAKLLSLKSLKSLMSIISLMLLMIAGNVQAQVRIGEGVSPVKGAVLDLSSSSSGYIGGLKLPNVELTSLTDIPASFKESVTSPEEKAALAGTIVYNTNTNAPANIFPGIYHWDGTKWVLQVTGGNGNSVNSTDAWGLNGNSIAPGKFLGTTNNQDLLFKVNNTHAGRINISDDESTSYGLNALATNSGYYSSAFGANALQKSMVGSGYNSAFGTQALSDNTIGGGNSAFGTQALLSNTTGIFNSALGSQALFSNTIGGNNNAFGAQALLNNTTGSNNSALGSAALNGNTTGSYNNAFGFCSLQNNTTGSNNSALGGEALYSNTTGANNSALGGEALYNNTTGRNNNAFGFQALGANTTRDFNSAFGSYALGSMDSGESNCAFGSNALRMTNSGNCNVAIGASAAQNLTYGSYNVIIGNNVQIASGSNNTVTIGTNNTNISTYYMYAAGWTNASDRRMKHDIIPINQGLSFVMKLKPSEFVYNTDANNKKSLGFIAQEVQETMASENMDGHYNLVQEMGEDMLGLNTTELIPVLTKAIQELQKTIEAQQAMIEAQQTINEQLEARLQMLEGNSN